MSSPAASPRPGAGVFVDAHGRRTRWTRRAGGLVGAAAVLYLAMATAAVVGAPWVPRATLPLAGSSGTRTPPTLGPDAVLSTPAVVPAPATTAPPPSTSAPPRTTAPPAAVVPTTTAVAPVTSPTTAPAPTTTATTVKPVPGAERRTTPSTRDTGPPTSRPKR